MPNCQSFLWGCNRYRPYARKPLLCKPHYAMYYLCMNEPNHYTKCETAAAWSVVGMARACAAEYAPLDTEAAARAVLVVALELLSAHQGIDVNVTFGKL